MLGREEYLLELADLKDLDEYPPLLGASTALFYGHHIYGGGCSESGLFFFDVSAMYTDAASAFRFKPVERESSGSWALFGFRTGKFGPTELFWNVIEFVSSVSLMVVL